MSGVPNTSQRPSTGPEKPGAPSVIGILAAVIAFGIVLVFPTPEGLTGDAQKTAALFVLILVLWSTEALPIAVTSLLALGLQPVLGLNPLGTAFTNFIGPVFFFVLVMFIIALAWVKTGLAKRFALWMIARAGTDAQVVATLGWVYHHAGLTARTVQLLERARRREYRRCL